MQYFVTKMNECDVNSNIITLKNYKFFLTEK